VENLLNPDFGLTFWTLVVFLSLVAVLGKFAWRPFLKVLEDREEGIRRAVNDATQARQSAESLKAQYQKDLAEAQIRADALYKQAQSDAQKLREQLMADAHAESARLMTQTQNQLQEEKQKVLRDIRKEVADLSVQMAEKLLRRSMTPQVQEEIISSFLKEVDSTKN